MQGRDSYIDSTPPLPSKNKNTYAVYGTLPVLKSGADFAVCLKCHFQFRFLMQILEFTTDPNMPSAKISC